MTHQTELNFTKETLEKLRPADSARTVYRDAKVRGLQLRVSSRGVKTFSLYRWLKPVAKPERITLGRFPDLSVEQARVKALKLIGRMAAGENPNEVKRALRKEDTLQELFDEFLEHKRSKKGLPLSEKTKEGYEGSFVLYLGGHRRTASREDAKTPGGLAARKLSQITDDDIAAICRKIGKESPYAANRTRALLSSLFSYAVETKRAKHNPAKHAPKFHEESRDRFLQADELKRFFQALADEPNRDYRDALLIALLTGARRGNVLSMQWKEVHLERAEWRIPGRKGKNRSPHVIALTAEALTILRARANDEPYVFPGTGKSGHLVEPKNVWRRVLQRAQALGLVEALASAAGWGDEQRENALALTAVEPRRAMKTFVKEARQHKIMPEDFEIADLRIHDLRRTLGSWQAKTGASLVIIGKSLNHKSPSSTAIYSRLDLDPVRESMERATAAMLAAAGLVKPAAVADIASAKKNQAR
jgi:integrase